MKWMFQRLAVACAAVAICGVSQAAAQDYIAVEGATPPPRALNSPQAERAKILLLRRYFDAIEIETLMRRTMESLTQALLTRERVSPEDRFAIQGAFDGAVDAIIPSLLADMTELYSEAFTVEELQALVAFYEGPVGRLLMQKTQDLTDGAAAIVVRQGPIFEQEFATRFRAIVAQDRTTRSPEGEPIPTRVDVPQPLPPMLIPQGY